MDNIIRHILNNVSKKYQPLIAMSFDNKLLTFQKLILFSCLVI